MSRRVFASVLFLGLIPVVLALLAGLALLSPMAAAYCSALAVVSPLLWAVGLAIGLCSRNARALILLALPAFIISLLVSPVFDAAGLTGRTLLVAARFDALLIAGGLGGLLRLLLDRGVGSRSFLHI